MNSIAVLNFESPLISGNHVGSINEVVKSHTCQSTEMYLKFEI